MRSKIYPELQITPIEGGVCCAAMLLHSHGFSESTARLREELDLGRAGSSMDQLASLFVSRGIPADPVQADADAALAVQGPTIVSWGMYGFVVLEKVSRNNVTIVDPAIGRRRAPRSEFNEQYAGFYLAPQWDKEEPGQRAHLAANSDTRDGDRPRPFVSAMLHAKVPLAGVALASMMLYVTDIGAPWAMQHFIDADMRSEHPVSQIAPIIAALVLIIGAGFLLRAKFISTAAVAIGRETSTTVLEHLLSLPYRYFDSRQPGELAYRLSGISQIRDLLSDQLFSGLFNIGGTIVYLGYLTYLNPPLAGAAGVWVALMLLTLFGSRAMFFNAIQNETSQTGRMLTEQLEAIQSILTIKTRPNRDLFMSKWRAQNEVALSYMARRIMLQGGVNAMLGVLQFSGPFAVVITGVLLWRSGQMSLGSVVAAMAVSTMLFGTVNAIYSSVVLVMNCRMLARRVEDITSTAPDRRGDLTPAAVSPVEVCGVQYRYTKDAPVVLDDVNLSVEPGSTIALVGPSGSGKSTLAKLILGLYTPTQGDVLVHGAPVTSVSPAHLYSRVSFVPQDVTLETATIHDNIALGGPATREEVENAARLACVHDDIMGFPAGYDTMINGLGANLSGGQRQRIALARAILDRPELLVLDEATSSLDARTEVDITGNLRELRCTTIVIAHRLASVVGADLTYVLEQGRIVESGTHTELAADPHSAYRRLFASQLSISDESKELVMAA